MNGLYLFCQWVTRFALTNFLWLLFNLSIAYLCFNLLFVSTSEAVLVNAATIAVLAPFLFFPATTAMFGVVRKWKMGEKDVPIIRSFWKYFKENYLRSLAGGFIIVPLWIILAIDYVYFTKITNSFLYLLIVVGIFMFVFTFHFFTNTVHFHLTFFKALKNSMLLSIGRPVHTIGIAASTAVILYVSFSVFSFLILVGMGSLTAYAAFSLYYRSLSQE